MASKLVHVELGNSGLPCRIFRDRSWRNFLEDRIALMTKAEAVKYIREQVFVRSKNDDGIAECEKCGRYITWGSMEMNEKKLRSLGGEVSLENCEALCQDCHQTGPDAFHNDRRWQSSKIKSEEGH